MAAQAFSRKAASLLLSPGPVSHLAPVAGPHPMPVIYQQSASMSSMAQLRGLRPSRDWISKAPVVRSIATASLVDQVKQKNEENPVIVYSKSWCPYCAQVKQLFSKLEVDAKIVELDGVVEGDDVQAALYDITSSRTVPQVFIGGQFVGGADDTLREERSGALGKRLEAVGIVPKAL